MEKMPQTLINVRVNDKHAVEDSAEVAAAVAAAEEALGRGRPRASAPEWHRAGGARDGGGS